MFIEEGAGLLENLYSEEDIEKLFVELAQDVLDEMRELQRLRELAPPIDEVDADELLPDIRYRSPVVPFESYKPIRIGTQILEQTSLSDMIIASVGAIDGTNFQSLFSLNSISGVGNASSIFIFVEPPFRPGPDLFDGALFDGFFDGGAGEDTISYENSTQRVSLKLGLFAGETNDAEFDTYARIENIIGTNFAHDGLEGDNGNNKIWGRDGNDFLWGKWGSDTLYGEQGNDNLLGQEGDDHLYGGIGNDNLNGGLGADTLYLSNDDYINGYVDRILNFVVADGDRINLSDLLSLYDPMTDSIIDFIQITDDGTDSTLAIDTSGGSVFQTIATITGVTGLNDEVALLSSGVLVL